MKKDIKGIKGESALLKKWLERKRGKTSSSKTSTGIPERPKGEDIPVSSGQLRLWFLQQLYPENPFYHYAEVYRLKGPLDVEILRQAIEQITRDHDILKTRFELKDGLPFQVIDPNLAIEWMTHDFTSLSTDQALIEAEKQAKQDAEQPFDLVNGPLTRISFSRLGGEDHLLVLTMHHIITDKWSMQVFREALASIYEALRKGQTPPTLRPPIQYADFSHWQTGLEANQEALEYWKKKLGGSLPMLPLPTDRPRLAKPSFRGAHRSQQFSSRLSDHIKALSKQANTTPFVFFLAAFKILLQRYTRQDDLLVGTPITNRDKVALEKLIGFFNNTVVLRSDLSDDPTFSELVINICHTLHK